MTSHAVFKVERANAGRLTEVTSDDIVSRQSIHTRESNALGVEGDCLYVQIEGNEAGVKRAKELFAKTKLGTEATKDVADKVKQAIADEEDAAAGGMGMIFGG